MSGAATHETPNRGILTLCVMLATIMQALDTTIANVALPYMQGNLSATQDQINWVLTSYIVAAAIMTPVTGFLAARLGRKRLFLIAVAGFTIASVLCGIAQSLPQMVLFRLAQGVFGAPLVPMSQSVLLDSYPKEKHGSAMAMWGVGVMVGPILGPTLGGWLTEYYNWRFRNIFPSRDRQGHGNGNRARGRALLRASRCQHQSLEAPPLFFAGPEGYASGTRRGQGPRCGRRSAAASIAHSRPMPSDRQNRHYVRSPSFLGHLRKTVSSLRASASEAQDGRGEPHP